MAEEIYTNSEYFGSKSPILRALDEVLRVRILEIRNTPTTWNTILPPDSYDSNFLWEQNAVPVNAIQAVGNFKEMQDLESKDTPTINFAMEGETIPLYKMESSIGASIEQLEHYKLWTSRGGFAETNLVNRLINSAKTAYQTAHDQLFLFGDGARSFGLLNHPNATDVTDKFADITSILDLFARLFMEMRTLTKGVSHARKIIISPAMYTLLQRFYDSSDKSDLEKLLEMPIDTINGVPIKPEVFVLDKVETTKEKPFGDIYVLSGNANDFLYYYLPLFIRPFREIGLRSFAASIKFKYSQPYIATAHSLLKCTPNKNIALPG